MKNQFQMTIDGNEATFEITEMPQTTAGSKPPDLDPARPVLMVTTRRDGKKVWSGIGLHDVVEGVPVISQFTTEHLTEVYRQARQRWYESQVTPPSA